MIKEKMDDPFQEYLDGEYNMKINKLNDASVYSCTNCGKDMKVKYDEDNKPISLWCNKCRELEFKIKRKFKMENGSENIKNKEDPYMALAQMKVLMEKTKPYWKESNVDSNHMSILLSDALNGKDTKENILSEIDEILKKAKIPEKYMIAESLD